MVLYAYHTLTLKRYPVHAYALRATPSRPVSDAAGWTNIFFMGFGLVAIYGVGVGSWFGFEKTTSLVFAYGGGGGVNNIGMGGAIGDGAGCTKQKHACTTTRNKVSQSKIISITSQVP